MTYGGHESCQCSNRLKGGDEMNSEQREQNPDVNSYSPDIAPGENPGAADSTHEPSDIEGKAKEDVIPVPPDANSTVPVEEPPETNDAPVGDVDDSPKRIA